MIPLSLISWAADHWLLFLCAALYLAVIVSCVVVILRENRNPIRSLAWVIALLSLPFVGFIFYMFFGRSLKGMHLISRRNRRKLLKAVSTRKADIHSLSLTPEEQVLARLVMALSHAPLVVNNKISTYTTGAAKFEALKRDILNARHSIFLQYYIFSDDRIGNEIAEMLIAKARAGLVVKVIYDHVGSFSSRSSFFRRMKEGGVDVHPFFRVTFPQLANRINWRNHRKIVVIDNVIGYIGGMNIADRYAASESDGNVWRDTHFRVEGDIVESLMYSFAIDWNFLKKDISTLPLTVPPTPFGNSVGMQFISSGPVSMWDNLTLSFLKCIGAATRSIYIQTPYFLPTDSLLHALEAAALAKIDVRIMLPGRSDSRMLRYASHSYITQCLRAGIKIYIYEPGMLHSKMMTVDDRLATVGSTNFDFRSFENNFECNLMVYDPTFNGECRAIFMADQKKCRKVTLSQWKKRPLSSRFMESLVRLFSPIL